MSTHTLLENRMYNYMRRWCGRHFSDIRGRFRLKGIEFDRECSMSLWSIGCVLSLTSPKYAICTYIFRIVVNHRFFFVLQWLTKIPPRRSYPRKRAVPDAVADIGSTLGEPQHTPAQLDKDLEIERLRLKNRRLREEMARSKSQASSTIFSSPPASIPRGVTREVLNEEEGHLKTSSS